MSDTGANPIESIYDEQTTASDALKEVLRQTETRITEQLSMAAAADQRAMTFAGLLLVVLALLLGEKVSFSGVFPGIAVVLFITSIVLCAISARPARMYGSGSSSNQLRCYVADRYPGYLASALIARNDEAIAKNDRVVKRAAALFSSGMLVALLAFGILTLDYFCDFQPTIVDSQDTEDSQEAQREEWPR